MEKETLTQEVINVLKTIYDPEIPVDIYELGLIYQIDVQDDFSVVISMTLTSPSCPVAETLPLRWRKKSKASSMLRIARWSSLGIRRGTKP